MGLNLLRCLEFVLGFDSLENANLIFKTKVNCTSGMDGYSPHPSCTHIALLLLIP